MNAEIPEAGHGQEFLFAVQQELTSPDARFAENKLYIAYLLTGDERMHETWEGFPEYTQNFLANIGLRPGTEVVPGGGLVRAAYDYEFDASEVLAIAPIIEDAYKRTGLLASLFAHDQDEATSERIGDLMADTIEEITTEDAAKELGKLLVKHIKKLTDRKMPGAQTIEKLARSLGRRFDSVRNMLDHEDDPNRYVLSDGTSGKTIIKHDPPPSRTGNGTPIKTVDTGGFL